MLTVKRRCDVRRGIPPHLAGFEGMSHEEWVERALARGYDRELAQRFANSYRWKLGELELDVPFIPEWRFTEPLWDRAGAALFVYERHGQYRFHAPDGTQVGPEQPHLSAMVAWTSANGWES